MEPKAPSAVSPRVAYPFNCNTREVFRRGLDREEANAGNPVPHGGSDGSSFPVPLHYLKRLDLAGHPLVFFPHIQHGHKALRGRSRRNPERSPSARILVALNEGLRGEKLEIPSRHLFPAVPMRSSSPVLATRSFRPYSRFSWYVPIG